MKRYTGELADHCSSQSRHRRAHTCHFIPCSTGTIAQHAPEPARIRGIPPACPTYARVGLLPGRDEVHAGSHKDGGQRQHHQGHEQIWAPAHVVRNIGAGVPSDFRTVAYMRPGTPALHTKPQTSSLIGTANDSHDPPLTSCHQCMTPASARSGCCARQTPVVARGSGGRV